MSQNQTSKILNFTIFFKFSSDSTNFYINSDHPTTIMFTIFPLLVDLITTRQPPSTPQNMSAAYLKLFEKLQELAREYEAQRGSPNGKIDEKLAEEIQKTFEAVIVAINSETDVNLDLTQELLELKESLKREFAEPETPEEEPKIDGNETDEPIVLQRTARSAVNLIRGAAFGTALTIIGNNFLGQIGRRLGNDVYDSAKSMTNSFRFNKTKVDDGYIYVNNPLINQMNKEAAMNSLFGNRSNPSYM